MSVELVGASKQLPQEIAVENPKYHERDKRLIWAVEIIQRKLRTEQEYAANQPNRPDYKHPVPHDKAPEVSDFFHLCTSPGERDPEIISEVISQKVGIAYSQNSAFRNTMEDEHLATSGTVLLANKQAVDYELYAIFDGHGGRQTATFAKTFFQSFFDRNLQQMNPEALTDTGIWNALKAAFVLLDEAVKKEFFVFPELHWDELESFFGPERVELFTEFNQQFKQIDRSQIKDSKQLVQCILQIIATFTVEQQNWFHSKLGLLCRFCIENSGTTATVSIKIGDQLWTANVGDSRALLKIGEEIIHLSEDASVDPNNRFFKSVSKRGGIIFGGMVNGMVGVARALNDQSMVSFEPKEIEGKYYILTPRPKITKQILPKDRPITLLLSCDGLWEVPSVKDVTPLLKSNNPTQTAFQLVRGVLEAKRPSSDSWVGKSALRGLCRDNITAMIIDLSESSRSIS